jgi:hypothetical protein
MAESIVGNKMKVTNSKNCYCYTCEKEFHYLGIARHRAMHRDRKEDCRIEYTNGDVYNHNYSKKG